MYEKSTSHVTNLLWIMRSFLVCFGFLFLFWLFCSLKKYYFEHFFTCLLVVLNKKLPSEGWNDVIFGNMGIWYCQNLINSLYKVISPERISLIVINNYPTILLSMQYYAEAYTTDFVNILCTVNWRVNFPSSGYNCYCTDFLGVVNIF